MSYKFNKICLIANKNSGNSDRKNEIIEACINRKIKIFEPESIEETMEIARKSLNDFELIIAAGGDGTINSIINGISRDFGKARLAVIPLGTGNDLARTLCIPPEPLEALNVIDDYNERVIDIIKISTNGKTFYSANVASGGFSGQVDENITEELKKSWGPVSYIIGAISTLPDLTNYKTAILIDDTETDFVQVLNIIVANCRTVGGGINIAPVANPEDGLLDLIVIKYGTAVDIASVVAKLATGNHIDSDMVIHKKVKKVKITSTPGMWFNVDGELITKETIEFEVMPQTLKVLAGNNYSPIL